MNAATLAEWVADARRRTFEIYDDLNDAQLEVPYLRIVAGVIEPRRTSSEPCSSR
jgi:hypothetical protein